MTEKKTKRGPRKGGFKWNGSGYEGTKRAAWEKAERSRKAKAAGRDARRTANRS